MSKEENFRDWLQNVRAKQRNILWPDTMINGRSADRVILKGSAGAPLIQRVGARLFGCLSMGYGLVLVQMAQEKERNSILIFAAICFAFGIKIILGSIKLK
jgi:hypothetical protein